VEVRDTRVAIIFACEMTLSVIAQERGGVYTFPNLLVALINQRVLRSIPAAETEIHSAHEGDGVVNDTELLVLGATVSKRGI